VPRCPGVYLSAAAILFMGFALVGLATGLCARYPRFTADNPSQVAGSFGGVAFMVAAVLFIVVILVLLGWPSSMYLLEVSRGAAPSSRVVLFMRACFTGAAIFSLAIWWFSMRSGIRALGVR
jgi:hypothetical protein